MFCTRHVIRTMCIIDMISPLCREEADIYKSSVMCQKAQKKLEQDLIPGYGFFQVHMISLIPRRMRMGGMQARVLGRGNRASLACICQITRDFKHSFPMSAFTTVYTPTFLIYIFFWSIISTVLSGSFFPTN